MSGQPLAPTRYAVSGHEVVRTEASGSKMSRYLIIIEETGTGFSSYSPDLPGCVATGKSRAEVEQQMKEAIEFHLDGLREEGLPIPSPRSKAAYCEVGS